MKKTILLLALGSFFLTGCPKHEIIPAPVPHVELHSEFLGTINGTSVELTQNVSGYFLEALKTKVILNSPTPSYAIYSAEMKSAESLVSIKINLGSVYFDAGVSQDPSLDVWNSFINANATPTDPAYTVGGMDGFEVVYRDGTGAIWTSDATGTDVKFTNIVQESDATGDYSKFLCTFNCTVFRTVGPNTYSLPITDAQFTAYFKR